jgi:hypothetical protein
VTPENGDGGLGTTPDPREDHICTPAAAKPREYVLHGTPEARQAALAARDAGMAMAMAEEHADVTWRSCVEQLVARGLPFTIDDLPCLGVPSQGNGTSVSGCPLSPRRSAHARAVAVWGVGA